jgi:hypothetical protein
MVQITENERKALLILFKNITTYYNANSLSKQLDISHVGTQKILKRFHDENLTISKTIGKSIVHKPNFENDYTEKLISFLLADEANKFKRFKKEFKTLSNDKNIIMIYGSAIKNYKNAKDIDLMIISEEKSFKLLEKNIKEIQEILPKRIHTIILSKKDFLKNTEGEKTAIIDIIKNAIILYGQDRYVKVIKNVTGF